ncbi:MAG: hypothetical protein V4544_05955 [Pseudomonadota bacterium]
MLKMSLQRTNQCVIRRGGTGITDKKTGANGKRVKIIDTAAIDFFQQLFLKEQITPEHWRLITDIRCLAFRARRRQGIRVRLQSHSQYWGMPLVCSDDGYVNARAERRWKLFMFYLKPFIDHQWLDKQMLELLLFGGHMLFADDVLHSKRKESDIDRLGLTLEMIHNSLLIIEYVYVKAHRRQ